MKTTTKTTLLLVCIMVFITTLASSVAIYTLYQTSFEQQTARLVETAKSRAKMIEAVARHDREFARRAGQSKETAANWTLAQILDAHTNFVGFGSTGEFTLAKRIGNDIVFFLRHRHGALQMTSSVPWGSETAEPMHRALKKQSGTIIGKDYRHEVVLAAFEPINILNLGLVAKIDLDEIRQPFFSAAYFVAFVAAAAILGGIWLFFQVSTPLSRRIEQSEALLKGVFDGSKDIIFAKDKEARCLTINNAGAEFFGMTREDIIGRSNEELLPEHQVERVTKDDQRVIQTGETIVIEESYEIDGENLSYLTIKSPLRDALGEIIGLVGTAHNITKNKENLAQIEEQRQQLEVAQSIANLGSWELDYETNQLSWSDEVYRIFGVTDRTEPQSYETFKTFVHPEDLPNLERRFQDSLEGLTNYDLEHRILRRSDHEMRYVHEICEHQKNERGEIIRSLGTVQDITVRKEAEIRLQESEALTRSIAQSALDGIVLIDGHGHVIFWNDAAEKVFGYSQQEIMGQPIHDILPPPQMRSIANENFAIFQKTGQGDVVGKTIELEALHKSGKLITIDLSVTAINRQNQRQALGIVRDISNRKIAEEKLKASEQSFRTFFEQAAVGVVLAETKSGQFHEVNDKFCEFLGYSKEELREMDFMEITHPDDLLDDLDNMKLLQDGSIQDFTMEKRYIRKDGEIVWANLFVSSTEEIGVPPKKHIAIIEDITSRKEVEGALKKESKARKDLEAIVNLSPVIAFLWRNQEGWPVEYVSESIRNWHYKPEDLYSGKIPFASMVHEDDLERVGNEVAEHTKSGVKQFTQEYRIRDANGEVRWIDDRIWVRRDSDGNVTHYQGVVLDITEKKEAEQQLWQLQKAESLGNLAGGIAHDINNMLLPILALSEMTKNDLPEDHRGRVRLDKVIEAGQRAKKLVEKILAFSHKEENLSNAEDFGANVQASLDLLRSTIPTTIKIESRIPDEEIPVEISQTEVQTVLINLGSNSAAAMDGKTGTIRVELSKTSANSKLVEKLPHLKKEKNYVYLRFKDSGHGMSKKVIDRIFDPFFTTKNVGEGTGLGLSLVRSVVDKHHGAIAVKSREGSGTTFDIFFPIID